MKSPRWMRCVWVCSPSAYHASFMMGSPVGVRISKYSLGELTRAIASRIPHSRKRFMVTGRSPMPAPTSRIRLACSYTVTSAPSRPSALAAAAPP